MDPTTLVPSSRALSPPAPRQPAHVDVGERGRQLARHPQRGRPCTRMAHTHEAPAARLWGNRSLHRVWIRGQLVRSFMGSYNNDDPLASRARTLCTQRGSPGAGRWLFPRGVWEREILDCNAQSFPVMSHGRTSQLSHATPSLEGVYRARTQGQCRHQAPCKPSSEVAVSAGEAALPSSARQTCGGLRRPATSPARQGSGLQHAQAPGQGPWLAGSTLQPLARHERPQCRMLPSHRLRDVPRAFLGFFKGFLGFIVGFEGFKKGFWGFRAAHHQKGRWKVSGR